MKFSTVVFFLILFLSAVATSVQGGEKRIEIASDGWKIIATLNMPAAENPLPVVIFCHTLWGGNRSHYDSLATVFADNGIASLRIDLRGHGESLNLGKLARRDLNPDYVFGAWPDVVAAHRYVKTVAGIDSNRIGFIGASYSGELVAKAGRNYEFGKAYVILSSGLFSPESIVWMEKSGVAWRHIVAEDDNLFPLSIMKLVQARGYAEVTLFETGGHATALLNSQPQLEQDLATWFKEKLQ